MTGYFDLDDEAAARADRLHAESVVVDGLVPNAVYLETDGYRDHLHRGGVDACNLTVADYQHDFEAAVEEVVRHRDLARSTPGFRVAETAAEIRDAAADGDVAFVLGFQDALPVEGDAWKLRAFDDLGVGIVQLTYNDGNLVGAGCCERGDAGLTNFGLDLVEELNERGVLVDLSHCADSTTMDAVEHSTDPVACTHVGVRELCDAPGRNKTDEQLRAVADGGGVVGVSFFPPLVRKDPDTHEVLPATVDDVLDHLDYLVDLVGVDHVGFGSDLNDVALDDGVTPPGSSLRTYRPDHPEVFGRGPTDVYDPYPEGLDRHTELGTLTRGLVDRGYGDDEIRKLLGGNFLRLFETVWGE